MGKSEELGQRLWKALNRLAKWRQVFAGWQLGTRALGDPESDAVRDHRELSLLLRVELTAITGLLLKKGIFTQEEFQQALMVEAEAYQRDLENKFPGMAATDEGITYDLPIARETMKGWRP